MLERINKSLNGGNYAVLAAMATGAGKTAVAATWVSQFKGITLYTCHTLSVIGQVPDEFAKWGASAISSGSAFIPFKEAMAQAKPGDTIAASATAIYNYFAPDFNMSGIDALIVDEAHHTPDGKTRTSIIVDKAKQSGCPVLGITATPWRMSKKQGFEYTWDDLVLGPTWADLHEEGHLCNVRLLGFPYISGAGDERNTDYKIGDTIDANANVPMFTEGALDMLLRKAKGNDGQLMKTLLFCVGQPHAVMLAKEAVKREIPTGLLISGDQHFDVPPEVETDRQKVNEGLLDGSIRLVINVNMVTEGYDCPDVEVVMCLRPTKSKALWRQMAGRGSRKSALKDELLLIDLTPNNAKLGHPFAKDKWTLKPRGEDKGPGEPITRLCTPRYMAYAQCVKCQAELVHKRGKTNICASCQEQQPSCIAHPFPSERACIECGEAQGKDCPKCGKFRLWKRFKTADATKCQDCILAEKIASEEQRREKELDPNWSRVLEAFERVDRNGNPYFKLRCISNRHEVQVANAFAWKWRKKTRIWDTLQTAAMAQGEPPSTIYVKLKRGRETRYGGYFADIESIDVEGDDG